MYHETPVTAARDKWFEGALAATAGCDLVFCDPDNGLEGKNLNPNAARASKHALAPELEQIARRRQGLILYQHIGRRGKAREQVIEKIRALADRLERACFGILYHRGSAQVFLVSPAERQAQTFLERAAGMPDGPWARHFDMIEGPNAPPRPAPPGPALHTP